MKRKALLIGNARGLSDTPLDLRHVTEFLMSYQGGAWNVGELECLLNKSAEDIMKVTELVRGIRGIGDQGDRNYTPINTIYSLRNRYLSVA